MAALEFCLPATSVADLLRTAPFSRPGRSRAAHYIWHDTADGALAKTGLSLREAAGRWLLEKAVPLPGDPWPPGTPAPLVAEAGEVGGLARQTGTAFPGGMMPVAGFKGRQWTTTAGDAALTVLEGELHGVVHSAPTCRAVLQAPTPALAALFDHVAAKVPISVPRWSLVTEAVGVARNQPPAPRHMGAPAIPPGMVLDDAIALVIGHLTDVLLAVADAAAAGRSPDGVHQMRVAIRRLRSALSVFRHAVTSPALDALRPGLATVAAVLGGARDWDVFLGGTGPAVAAVLGDDPRLVAMLVAANRRRTAAYATLRRCLAGPDFRDLTLALVKAAALRPWLAHQGDGHAVALDAPAAAYAASELKRRTTHLLKAGADIRSLPVAALHDLRKQGKRLRYAAEFFAPLLDRRTVRGFIDRLAALQEALGHLNDAATAARLMGGLGGGAAQQFAAGAVQGYTAALAGDVHAEIEHHWKKFRKSGPFW